MRSHFTFTTALEGKCLTVPFLQTRGHCSRSFPEYGYDKAEGQTLGLSPKPPRPPGLFVAKLGVCVCVCSVVSVSR